MFKKIFLIVILMLVYTIIYAIEYGNYLELQYAKNGFKLIKSSSSEIIFSWQKVKEINTTDKFFTVLALNNPEYKWKIAEFSFEIYNIKGEKIGYYSHIDNNKYTHIFLKNKKIFFKTNTFGYIRAVYPLGFIIYPVRNIVFREKGKNLSFQIKLVYVKIKIEFPKVKRSNYIESSEYERLYSGLFLNGKYVNLYYKSPRENNNYIYKKVNWAPEDDNRNKYVHITVLREGLQKISGYELIKYLPNLEKLNVNNFYLIHKGISIPFLKVGFDDGIFNLEDYIVFYGEVAPENNIYTDTGEYFLVYSENPITKKIPVLKSLPFSKRFLIPAKVIYKTQKFEAEYEWTPELNIEDGWWWLKIPPGREFSIAFDLPDYVKVKSYSDKKQKATFKVYLAYEGEKYPLNIYLDSIKVNEHQIHLIFDNIYPKYIKFDVPLSYLKRGKNKISFCVKNSKKSLYIDKFFITYPAKFNNPQYLEFFPKWKRTCFRYENLKGRAFLYSKKNKVFYQPMEGNEGEYVYGYSLPKEFLKKKINSIEILGTYYTYRLLNPYTFIRINKRDYWEGNKRGIYIILYNIKGKKFEKEFRIRKNIHFDEAEKIFSEFRKILNNLSENNILFITTCGDYFNNYYDRILFSILYKMGFKKNYKKYFKHPFAMVIYKSKRGLKINFYSTDSQNEFDDDLFIVLSKKYDNKKYTYNFARRFLPHDDLISATYKGLKRCMIRPVYNDNLRKKQQCDFVIIYHPDFYENIKKYAEYIEKEKHLKVKLANIYSIYDNFNYGYFDPRAINTYLKYVFRNYNYPLPSYLLLVGDATWDYKRYYDTDVDTFVPSYHPPSKPKSFCIEPFFARISDDRLSDISLGRWSVSNNRQLENIIEKVKEYENRKYTYDDLEWINKILFLCDDGYEHSGENILKDTVPRSYFIKPLYLKDFPLEDNRMFPMPKRRKRSIECTNAVINEINKGINLLFYVGHGGPNVLAHERILLGGGTPHSDGGKLKNKEKYPIIIVMSCLQGFFDYHAHPWNISMLEDFLFRKEAGIIGGFAPSGKGVVAWDKILAKSILDLYFPFNLSIGTAITGARVIYSLKGCELTTNDMFLYLGDPSLKPVFPKLRTSIDYKKIEFEKYIPIKGTLFNIEFKNKAISYIPNEDFSGEGKLIVYNADNIEIYRKEHIKVENGKWKTEILLPDVETKKLIFRAIFLDETNNNLAIGSRLCSGYKEVSIKNKNSTKIYPREKEKGVYIKKLEVDNKTPIEGNSVFIKIFVKNSTNKVQDKIFLKSFFSFVKNKDINPKNITKWKLLQNKSSMSNSRVLSLQPWEEKIVYFKFDPDTKNGTCYIKIELSQNLKNKKNYYTKIYFYMRPDISIEEVKLINMVKKEFLIKFSVKIANLGELPAKNFFVSIRKGHKDVLKPIYVKELKPGEEKTLIFEGKLGFSKNKLFLFADSGNDIEGNERNGRVFEHLEPARTYQKNNVRNIIIDFMNKTFKVEKL